MKRVLFLGAGRRVEMAQLWIDRGWEVFSYEDTQEVPISAVATIIIGKRFADPAFRADLAKVIKQYNITLVIPFQDSACFYLSVVKHYKDRIVNSNLYTSTICYDKKKLEERFCKSDLSQYGFYPYPHKFPLVAKPRFGFGSKEIHHLASMDDDMIVKSDKYTDYIYQADIEGDEYTVDCYFDRSSKFVDCVPRKRIRVAGGEVISSITVDSYTLFSHVKRISDRIPFVGAVNMQFIKDQKGDFYLIEINSRFGGGSTLSITAGMDMISLIERDWLGLDYQYTPGSWKVGMKMERSYDSYYFYEGMPYVNSSNVLQDM